MRASKIKSDAKRRIMVVDDHPLVREGLIQLIRRQSGLTVCGEADSVSMAKQVALKTSPDLLILDLRLNQGDGLDLIKHFHFHLPSLRILVLSQLDEMLYVERVLRAGAHGYLMKEEAAKEVVLAIRLVLDGGLYVSPAANGHLLRKLIQAPALRPSYGVESLTDREFQVFQKLGAGLSSRQIATELFLSIKTVEAHRENIKVKIGASDSAALIHEATISFHKANTMHMGIKEPTQ
jgi:DNA-binding NarL/FixJ family response regulator